MLVSQLQANIFNTYKPHSMAANHNSTPPNPGCDLVRIVTPLPETLQHETVTVSDQELFDLIANDSMLSADSKEHYLGAMKRLVQGTDGRRGCAALPALIPNASLLWVVTHPEQALELLTAELTRRGMHSPHNIHNYTQPIRAILRRHPYLKKLADIRERWTARVVELSTTPLALAAKNNQPTERQARGFVCYPEIVRKFQQLCQDDLGGRDPLLVGLIAMAGEDFYPQRVDYGNVKLYIGQEPPDDIQGNYLVLRQCSQNVGGVSGTLVLQEYKTAFKYGSRKFPLPACYINALLESLKREPRSYLFTKQRGPPDTPYEKSNSFGRYASNRFKEIFGKPLTFTGARHSCVSHLHSSNWWAKLSDAEREAVATKMSHSFATACRYRFVPRSVAAAAAQQKALPKFSVELV